MICRKGRTLLSCLRIIRFKNGLALIKCKPLAFCGEKVMKNSKLTNEETAYLCREMELIVRSGLDAGGAMALVAADSDIKSVKETALGMAEELDTGLSLASAIRKCGRFPDYVCALAEVGETTGKSEEAFRALSGHYFRQAKLERGLKNALLYPAMLVLVMLAVIVVLLTKVLPVFEDVYARLGASLSGAAAWLMDIGRALSAAMPLVCLILAAVIVLVALFALSESFRRRVIAVWRARFGDRGLGRSLARARFAGALAMGLQSGMNAEESVSLAGLTLAGTPAAERCAACGDKLGNGAGLGTALLECELLPARSCRLLELGEKGGCADTVMAEIADKLTEESEEALHKSLGKVEPTLVLICCAIVAVVLLSVMLPLLNIMSAIG